MKKYIRCFNHDSDFINGVPIYLKVFIDKFPSSSVLEDISNRISHVDTDICEFYEDNNDGTYVLVVNSEDNVNRVANDLRNALKNSYNIEVSSDGNFDTIIDENYGKSQYYYCYGPLNISYGGNYYNLYATVHDRSICIKIPKSKTKLIKNDLYIQKQYMDSIADRYNTTVKSLLFTSNVYYL